MPLEKDKRRFWNAGNILTLLAMAGAVAVTYADNRVENARQKERVDNLKEEAKEIKNDVKDTKSDVQLILRKLVEMEARQKERDRQVRSARSEVDR